MSTLPPELRDLPRFRVVRKLGAGLLKFGKGGRTRAGG